MCEFIISSVSKQVIWHHFLATKFLPHTHLSAFHINWIIILAHQLSCLEPLPTYADEPAVLCTEVGVQKVFEQDLLGDKVSVPVWHLGLELYALFVVDNVVLLLAKVDSGAHPHWIWESMLLMTD